MWKWLSVAVCGSGYQLLCVEMVISCHVEVVIGYHVEVVISCCAGEVISSFGKVVISCCVAVVIS